MSFRDHFSGHADLYALARPSYPDELFAWLAAATPHQRLALDVGTGNGQAAVALAQRFDEVVATDASEEQVALARPHPKVRYAARPADQSGLPDQSVDLLTVAQAYHWFDAGSFHQEARRVLRPGGVIAVWCYEIFSVDDAFDEAVAELYHGTLGSDWPPERRHIESGYETLPWPWPREPSPSFTMTATWRLEGVLAYLRSWSATQRHLRRTGVDAVTAHEPALRRAWRAADEQRLVSWPLRLVWSRVPQVG